METKYEGKGRQLSSSEWENAYIHGGGGSAGGSNAGNFVSHITHIGTDQQLLPTIDPKTEVAKTYTDPSKVNDETGYETNDKGVTGDDGKSKGEKVAGVVALALDSHNVAMDGAAVLSKSVGDAMKIATKTTGLVGVTISGVLALKDISENGAHVGNVTSLILGGLSAAVLLIPGIGEAAEAISISIDAVSFGVDGATLIKDTYDMAHPNP